MVLYLWRPQYANWFDDLPHDFSIYHIDDEYSFTEHDVPTSHAELDVLDRANHVIIHSRGLMEKKGGGRCTNDLSSAGSGLRGLLSCATRAG